MTGAKILTEFYCSLSPIKLISFTLDLLLTFDDTVIDGLCNNSYANSFNSFHESKVAELEGLYTLNTFYSIIARRDSY